MTYYTDDNFDTQWDEILTREDLWMNSDWVLDEAEDYLIYETYSDVILQSDPIYNTTDPDYDPNDPDSNQIIGYESYYIEERGNSLEENLTIYLPCTVKINTDENGNYLEYGDENFLKSDKMEYNGSFIVEQYGLVPIDPRYNLPVDLRTVENGLVYWADINEDGYYETGFIASPESGENIIVSIYLSRSGYSIPFIDEDLYISSGDSIIPLYWFGSTIDFKMIKGMAWNDAVNDYIVQFNSFSNWIHGEGNLFWQTQMIDTVATVLIMGSAALIGMIPFMQIPAFIYVMGMYSLYQYVIRPKLLDSYKEDLGISEPRILRYVIPQNDKFTWKIWEGSQDFDLPGFTTNVVFRQSNPFWDDTPWQEYGEPDLDETVEIQMQIPDIYNNEPLSVGFVWWLKWFKDAGGMSEIIDWSEDYIEGYYVNMGDFDIDDRWDLIFSAAMGEMFVMDEYAEYTSQEYIDYGAEKGYWDSYTFDYTSMDFPNPDFSMFENVYSTEDMMALKIRIWRFMAYYFMNSHHHDLQYTLINDIFDGVYVTREDWNELFCVATLCDEPWYYNEGYL